MMKSLQSKFLLIFMFALILNLFRINMAYSAEYNAKNETEKVSEKITETKNDTKRTLKKGARKAKDETCEMVNGKMECLSKKAKHTAESGADRVEDAVD